MSKKKPYKEPVFLFTSGSLHFAAWAGWCSAFGDKNNAEKWRLKKKSKNSLILANES